MSPQRFRAADLIDLATAILHRVGAPPDHAKLVAEHLVAAGLSGHDTHGLLRLPQYVELARDGSVRPGAPLTILADGGVTVSVSGNWNYGPVTATQAVQLAVERARAGVVSCVTVRDCNHVGRLGAYAALATAARQVILMAANGHGADLAVVPPGGRGRRLPTNPLCVGIPTARPWPVVLDMTTSAVSGGFMRLLRNTGAPAPPGSLVDAAGQPSCDVGAYYGPPAGALQALGAPAAAHKGFGLGLLLDVLAGALSGAGCSGPDAPRGGNALFIVAVRVESLRPWPDFCADVEALVDHLRRGAPGMALPGEHGYVEEMARRRDGVPVDAAAWKQIRALAAEYGVAVPAPWVSPSGDAAPGHREGG